MAGKTRVEFFGTSELLQKLEKAGANVEEEIVNALKKSVQKPKNEMIEFMRTQPKRKTGKTISSMVEEIKEENGKVFCEVGFSVRKGGIASIFWNLGTPYKRPTYFIDKAVENNIDEIKRSQLEALKKSLGGLLQ